MTTRHPTPTQAWLAFERRSMGLSLLEAADAFGTSRSVLQRAERGGRNGSNSSGLPPLLDRIAMGAGVELGSWPAPDADAVARVLGWWRQHPLDRLAGCLETRCSDWQTLIRHFVRQLLPLPALVTGQSALAYSSRPMIAKLRLSGTSTAPGWSSRAASPTITSACSGLTTAPRRHSANGHSPSRTDSDDGSETGSAFPTRETSSPSSVGRRAWRRPSERQTSQGRLRRPASATRDGA